MIKLMLVMFALQSNLLWLGDDDAAARRFCAQVQLAASFIDSAEMYEAAETHFDHEPNRMLEFAAFWENVDTCDPSLDHLAPKAKPLEIDPHMDHQEGT